MNMTATQPPRDKALVFLAIERRKNMPVIEAVVEIMNEMNMTKTEVVAYIDEWTTLPK